MKNSRTATVFSLLSVFMRLYIYTSMFLGGPHHIHITGNVSQTKVEPQNPKDKGHIIIHIAKVSQSMIEVQKRELWWEDLYLVLLIQCHTWVFMRLCFWLEAKSETTSLHGWGNVIGYHQQSGQWGICAVSVIQSSLLQKSALKRKMTHASFKWSW